jgi:hypothetical protein
MLRQVKQIAIAMFAMAAMAAPASAVTIIDFATGSGTGSGGNVYASGSGYIGEDIPIGRLLVEGAPMGNGDYDVRGTAFGTVGGNIYGDLDFNTNTGDITLTGCVPGLVGAAAGATSCETTELLLGGTITSFVDPFGSNNFVALAALDFKNATLLSNLGLDPNTPFSLVGSVLTAGSFGQGPQLGRPAISTDVANTAIPEPATMMLLGTGLLAAFRARRKQQDQQL